MEYFGEITATTTKENGAELVTFILNTKTFSKTYEIFKNFQISPLPVNVPMLKKLSPTQWAGMPSNIILRIELSFEDCLPYNAFEVDLTQAEVDLLKKTNQNNKKIRFILEGKDSFLGKKKSEVLHDLFPYNIDWYGVLGLYVLFRLGQSGEQLQKRDQTPIIDTLELHLKENGYATGIYTELGLLHRLNNNFDNAEECYLKEIAETLSIDGLPTIAAIKTINNLAVLYKKQQKLEAALELFKTALYLNNNFFESYLGISGLLDDFELSLKCIARAYRIRSNDQNIDLAVEAITQHYKKEKNVVIEELNRLVKNVDLAKPIDELQLTKLNPFIKDMP